MKYIKLTKYDTANGLGIRTVLWVSGCSHHCKGCHNPNTWDPSSGISFTDSTLDEILDSLNHPYISGLTFSGGDPLYPTNICTVEYIAKKVKELYPDKVTWLYTGYLYEDISHMDIMNYIDVLVDGEFILEQRDITLAYKGSPNQRIIDVSKSRAMNQVILYEI